MVQPSLHGRMALVHSNEISDPATQLRPADGNRFQATVQAEACRLVAGMPIGDERAFLGQSIRHRWSDVNVHHRRESFHIGRPAARNRRQDSFCSGPKPRLPRLAPRSRGRRRSCNDLFPLQLSRNSSRQLPRCHSGVTLSASSQECDATTGTPSGRRFRSARPIDAVPSAPAGIPQTWTISTSASGQQVSSRSRHGESVRKTPSGIETGAGLPTSRDAQTPFVPQCLHMRKRSSSVSRWRTCSGSSSPLVDSCRSAANLRSCAGVSAETRFLISLNSLAFKTAPQPVELA